MTDNTEPDLELSGDAASKALSDAFVKLRGGQPGGGKTASQEEESKPLTAQRKRAEAVLQGFGIGPQYKLSYVEAVNAMQIFARNEGRDGALLLAALDNWVTHAQACVFGPDECVDCRDLFDKKALAYEVWKFGGKRGATR
jgi:hypothetical protein